MKTVIYNILAIYRRELQSYFFSPLAYAIAAVFWFLSGLMFVNILLGPQGMIARAAFQDQMGGGMAFDVPYEFLRNFLSVLGSIAIFVLPILSMSLYTEERKRGTLELLATSPITNWAVALGKLLAVVTFFITLLLPVMVYEAFTFAVSDPPATYQIFWLGHLGLVLMAASILSLGMFISSLTDSTILAGFLTFGLVLLLGVIDLVAASVQGDLGTAIAHFSLFKHFSDLTQGIVNTSGIVLFVSYILLGVFLTAQSIQTFRYQKS